MGRIELRVPDVDLAKWKQRADAAGLTVSDWIREKCRLGEANAIPDLPKDRDVHPPAKRGVDHVKNAEKPAITALREQIPELTVAAELPSGSVLDRLPVVGEQHVAKPGAKTCKHGTQKGYRCWQCGGLANVEQ